MLSRLALRLYRIKSERLRSRLRGLITRLEGGEMVSDTLRVIYKEYYGVEVGKYSHGSCYDLYLIDPHTKIGRYCSFARGIRVINHNHPLDFKGTSAIFFNPAFGNCDKWLVDFNPIEIGNDVWIGANAIILPEVNRIGDGAIIGAGAVVNKDVPPFAVVLGNPARVVKYRFSEEKIRQLLEEKWWEKNVDELKARMSEFQSPLEPKSGTSD